MHAFFERSKAEASFQQISEDKASRGLVQVQQSVGEMEALAVAPSTTDSTSNKDVRASILAQMPLTPPSLVKGSSATVGATPSQISIMSPPYDFLDDQVGAGDLWQTSDDDETVFTDDEDIVHRDRSQPLPTIPKIWKGFSEDELQQMYSHQTAQSYDKEQRSIDEALGYFCTIPKPPDRPGEINKCYAEYKEWMNEYLHDPKFQKQGFIAHVRYMTRTIASQEVSPTSTDLEVDLDLTL